MVTMEPVLTKVEITGEIGDGGNNCEELKPIYTTVKFLKTPRLGKAPNRSPYHRIYYDAEFTGLHRNTTFISIGLVSESGSRFYAEFNDYDKSQVNYWIQENVIDTLTFSPLDSENPNIMIKNYITDNPISIQYNIEMCGTTDDIRRELLIWLHAEYVFSGKVLQFHVDCYAYDWMLLVDILTNKATAMEMPNYIQYIPIDLSTLLWTAGLDPDLSREEFAGTISFQNTIIENRISIPMKHNALYDAYVIKACFEKFQLNFLK